MNADVRPIKTPAETALSVAFATAWWVVPLLLLGHRVSPSRTTSRAGNAPDQSLKQQS